MPEDEEKPQEIIQPLPQAIQENQNTVDDDKSTEKSSTSKKTE